VNVKMGAAANSVDHLGFACIDIAYPLLCVSHALPGALPPQNEGLERGFGSTSRNDTSSRSGGTAYQPNRSSRRSLASVTTSGLSRKTRCIADRVR
jgi:hypothetical protein